MALRRHRVIAGKARGLGVFLIKVLTLNCRFRTFVRVTLLFLFSLSHSEKGLSAERSQFQQCELEAQGLSWIAKRENPAQLAEVEFADEVASYLRSHQIPFYYVREASKPWIPVVLVNKKSYPALRPLLFSVAAFGTSYHPQNSTDHGWLLGDGFLVDYFDPGKAHRIKQGEVNETGIVWKDLDRFTEMRDSKKSKMNISLRGYLLPESQRQDFFHYHRVRRAAVYRVAPSAKKENVDESWYGESRRVRAGGEHCFTYTMGASVSQHIQFMSKELEKLLRLSSTALENQFFKDPLLLEYWRNFESTLRELEWSNGNQYNFPFLYKNEKLQELLKSMKDQGVIPASLSDEDVEKVLAFAVGVDAAKRFNRVMNEDIGFQNRHSIPEISNGYNPRQQFFFIISEMEEAEAAFREANFELSTRRHRFPKKSYERKTADF